MRFAIVGCGLIGQKRTAAISRLGHRVALAVDRSRARAVELADPVGARVTTDFRGGGGYPRVRGRDPTRRTVSDRDSLPGSRKACSRRKARLKEPCRNIRRRQSGGHRWPNRKDRLQSPLPPGDNECAPDRRSRRARAVDVYAWALRSRRPDPAMRRNGPSNALRAAAN